MKPTKVKTGLRKKIQNSLFGGASGNVFRGMAVLAGGSGLARLISVLTIPLVTRLYSPEDYGVLSVFSSLILMLVPFVTLRYVLALPLPRYDGIAINLLVLSGIIMLLSFIIIAVSLCYAGPWLFSHFSMPLLIPWWWLIAIGVLVSAFYELLTFWATRYRSYKAIAVSNIWQSVLGVLVKIVLGIIGFKPGGLLIGQVVAQSGGIGKLLLSFSESFRKNWSYVRFAQIKRVALRYKDFPLYRVPSQFLMVFSKQAPLLFVASIYDAETTGQLGLAFMVLALPVSLFGQTTAKAFYAEASSLDSRQVKAIQSILVDVLKRLGVFAILPAITLYFGGELLFLLVFGVEWRLAGVFASLLSVYLFFQFLQTPVAHIFMLFDGHKKLLMLNIQHVVIMLTIFVLANCLSWYAETTIKIYAVFLGLHYSLSILYAFRFISKKNQM